MNRRSFLKYTGFVIPVITVGQSFISSVVKAEKNSSDPFTTLLWYKQPAKAWTEALPVGNGRLGAMIFGRTDKERIQFNEDTLWNGGPHDYSHKGAVQYLPEIRKMLQQGKQKEAEALAMEHFMSVPLRQRSYQAFGDLNLNFPGHENVSGYRRELDIAAGIASVNYKVGGQSYKREIFSSAVDQVIVIHITGDKKEMSDFSFTLSSIHKGYKLSRINKNSFSMTGRVQDSIDKKTKEKIPGVVKFEARIKILAEKGDILVTDQGIEIKKAANVTILLAGATSVKNYQDVSAEPSRRCEKALQIIQEKSYDKIREDHIKDHQKLFNRVSLDLGSSEISGLPTDERIKKSENNPDPALAVLYFQYGRYLLIASSRPKTQPANLQGIWNESNTPPWDSKWTVNINTEMNFWPAELCNLSECHDALFDMIKDVSVTGRKTAKVHYNCNGWVLHHNIDLWRGTAPINRSNHGIWVTGGAWLCQHLWERYLFTCDKKFLKEKAYPLIKGAAEFFVDFLVVDPKTGWLISTPSNSPENGGLVAGPTMDHQIIRYLFASCIEAGEILGVDKSFREKLVKMRKKIAPNQIGQHGQLQEWLEDIDNPNNHHRHVSHMWGLHPGNEITKRDTPDLFNAAKQSLVFRGDGGTGWSMAWKVNLWARLEDGNHSYKMLLNLLAPAIAGKKNKDKKKKGGRRGGVYPNLFDAHPPFQIDGNFGGTAGMAEMLLQSHNDEVHLLPALPDAWPKGNISGLRGRGGFEIDITWKDSKLEKAKFVNLCNNKCLVRYNNKVLKIDTKKGDVFFITRKGDSIIQE